MWVDLYGQEEITEYESPGLFSLSPKWFKMSEYEIVDTPSGLYIAPQKDSEIIWYQPFKLYPQILLDYIELAYKIVSENDRFNDKEEKYGHIDGWIIPAVEKRDYRQAQAILPFVKKYGLFGLFFECIDEIRYDRNDPEKFIAQLNDKGRLLTSQKFSLSSSFISTNSYAMEYEKYAANFFPQMSGPLPSLRKSREEALLFRRNYAEKVCDIVFYRDIKKFIYHLNKFKEFESKRANLDDLTETLYRTGYKKVETFRQALELKIDNLGLEMAYEDGSWGLKWKYKGLLSALSVMYVMNTAGKMGNRIRVCQYSKCDKPVLNNKYCCSDHCNAARQERYRARKKEE